jgi:hypothetical protein
LLFVSDIKLSSNANWVSGIKSQTTEPSKSFEVRTNTEAVGAAILSMKITTKVECEKQCLSRQNCVVYTYNIENKSCFLYPNIQFEPNNNAYWVSGIRIQTTELSKNFNIKMNTEALGAIIFSIKNTTRVECEKQCLSRSNCSVYTHNQENKSCFLYHDARLEPNNNAYWVSGIRMP